MRAVHLVFCNKISLSISTFASKFCVIIKRVTLPLSNFKTVTVMPD